MQLQSPTPRIHPILFIYPWIIVACGMMFYCFNYFLRVSPSIMQPELTQAFHINASHFGALAAFYYYAYTAMQVPAGMIYDKFGVRLVVCLSLLVASLGLTVFINSHSYYGAGLGRFLIGLGCAFAYIGTLKLASIWLPSNRFGTVAGLTTAIGMVSGAMAQKYLSHFVETIGYQAALESAVFAGFILSVISFSIIRNQPKEHHAYQPPMDMNSPINLPQLGHALRIIFSNPQMWLIGIIGCLIYLPSSVFLDLWGVPYLENVYHITTPEAVKITGLTFYGWIIAGPTIGFISDKIKRRVIPMISTGFFAGLLLAIVFYIPDLSLTSVKTIFFFIGFCCGAHSLVFALGKENNPLKISGTAVAVTNMLIMLGGVIFQPLVGALLDFHTSAPLSASGLPTYSPADYTFALSVVPIGVALGVFLSLFLKETYCESQAKDEHERIFNTTDEPELAADSAR